MSKMEVHIAHQEIGYDSFVMNFTISYKSVDSDLWTRFEDDWIRDHEVPDDAFENLLRAKFALFAGELAQSFLYKLECPFVDMQEYELSLNDLMHSIKHIRRQMVSSINVSKARHERV